MKAPRNVCLLCRHQFATAGSSRFGQQQQQQQSQQPWISRAGLTTLSPLRNGHPSPRNPSHATTPVATASSKQKPRPPIRRVRSAGRPGPSPGSDQLKSTPIQSSARADALFQQIVKDHRTTNSPASKAPTSLPSPGHDLTLVHDVARLQDMVDGGASISEAFAFLKTEIYPLIRQSGSYVPQIFYSVVWKLMDRAVAAKGDDMLNSALPRVADIFHVYADIGELKPQQWALLVSKLVQKLVDMSTDPDDYPSIESYEHHLASREAMLLDLVESWKVLSLPKFTTINTEADSEIDGFWFPRLDKFSLSKFARSNNFTAAFCTVFPQYPANALGSPVAALAIATYALLQDRQRTHANARRDAIRFVAKVAHLITVVRIKDEALCRLIRTTFPGLEAYVMGEWPKIKLQLKARLEEVDHVKVGAEPAAAQVNSAGKVRINAASLGSRLGQAYGTRNPSEVERLWHQFIGLESELSEERAAELKKYPDLFDSFINTHMALNNADKAIDAWNTMRKVGLRPTLKTWNVMLDGCRKARNLNGLTNIWSKLVASKMPLDIAVWTTRVAGLIDCGDTEAGIKALEELTRSWNKALELGETSRAVKPSIQPVNAALAGLIRLRRLPIAEKLLQWSARQGIEPDIITFNTLLRPLIREDRDEEVRRLFAAMDSLGIKADAATFTIVLDATLAKSHAATAEEQTEMVSRILVQMKEAGLETNLQTYGKMVYLLLLSGDRAKEAVKAVLAHLWSEGHELSPHIYTMLVEHYFSRSPPDLEAVESLIKRRRLLDYDDMDRVFYDRVIKGYALVGDIKALETYYKLIEAGYITTLGTQTELLRMLLRQERRDEARGLVNTTKEKYEELHGNRATEDDNFWKHTFWHIADRHGFLQTATPHPPNANTSGIAG